MIGIDISNWQRGFDLGAASGQLDFVILKASEYGWRNGNGGIDPTFDGFASTAEARGLRLGAYMFARDTSHGDVASQVDLFVRAVGRHMPHCVVVLDWEDTNYSHVQGNVGLCRRFLDEIARRTGKTPMLYTSQSEVRWNDYQGIHDAGFPLWGACYLNRNAGLPIGSTSDPSLPSGGWGAWGGRPDIYQYSSTGRLIGWELDANVAYISAGDWDRLAGGGAPQPVDPTHVDEDGWWGPATTLAMQVLLNSPYQDMKVSGQYRPNWEPCYPAITGETLEFDGGSGESWLVKKIQEQLGADRDGVLGHDTVRRWQERLRGKGYASILDPAGGADGVLGAATALCIQKSINAKSMF